MQLEEHTPAYRGFLRSGQYPALSLRLRKSGEVAGRAASLVALAALAAGAGYKLTQRVVATKAPIAQAHVGSMDAAPVVRPALGALSVAHAAVSNAPVEPTRFAAVQPPLAASVRARTGTGAKTDNARPIAQATEAHPVRHKSSEPAANVSSDALPPTAANPALDQARAEQIAERVRALDEGAHAAASAPVAHGPARSLAAAPKPAKEEPSLPSAAAPKPVAAPPVVAQPAASAVPLRAAASIAELEVRGSLSAASVRHGVERVQPAFATCYAQAAQQAKRNEFGKVQLRFTIDETGRTRAAKVANAPLPGLEECLRSALGKLVCKAPDTGTVQAALLVSFAP